MGVPVIALRGDRHSARVGASILANAGLAGLVAGSIDEYVSLAVRLARDAERLRELRRTIRDRVAASPLRDAPGFTRTLENAYRDRWARWCPGATGNPVEPRHGHQRSAALTRGITSSAISCIDRRPRAGSIQSWQG